MSSDCPQCGTRWGQTSATMVNGGEAAKLFTCPKCGYSTTQRTRKSMKRQYVIRVVIGIDDTSPLATCNNNAPLIKCLRHLGHVTLHRDDHEGFCFDIRCPKGMGSKSKLWSEEGAEKMKSYGFNAVSAPATE